MAYLQEEILEFINDVIDGENGVPGYINDPLDKSELDSLGYAILFVMIKEKYDVDVFDTAGKAFNSKTTFKDLVDLVGGELELRGTK